MQLKFLCISVFLVFSFLSSFALALQSDPLPAWTDQINKKEIIQFVRQVTDAHGKNYVKPEDRIATFDNDGTLRLEQPIYTEILFSFDRIKQLASQHPEWNNEEPFKTVLSGDMSGITKLTNEDFQKIVAVAGLGMSQEEFVKAVNNWLQTTENPRFHRPYMSLTYEPMLEVIRYLQKYNFKVYIVTGGSQDFVRAYEETEYGLSPEKIIGTPWKTKFSYQNGQPVLIKLPDIYFMDDKAGKPEGIELFIGKKPLMAFGNSDGDQQMLEWTQSRKGPHFMALVQHDDALREYTYGPDSKIGTFSDALMAEAQQQGWHVISMKQDWKTIFP